MAKQLIVENAIDVDEETFENAIDALRQYFGRYGSDEDEMPLMAARYEFHLRRVYPYGERIYGWSVVPLGGNIEVGSYDGQPRAKTYPTPRAKILPSVPDDPSLAYRGMAWEEWQFIREKGYVESSGSHNLDQPNLTFFGDADQAEYYASGFAPLAYKPAWRRPGVVIAAELSFMLQHEDWPEKIPAGEYAREGRLSAEKITAVWFLIPTRITFGMVEVLEDRGRIGEGSRSSPSVGYVVKGQ